MKNIFITIIVVFAFSAAGFSQRSERIQSLKVAFITEELKLTPKESQEFWPIYNELQEQMKTFREDKNRNQAVEDLTDKEAEAIIQKRFETEQKRLDLKRTYFKKLNHILPARKLVRLSKAEQQFKRKLLDRMKNRRGKRGRGGDRF